LTTPVLRFDDIEAGASVKMVMGPAPSRWAADWKPVSISDASKR
jgi:hypothetical protein